MAIDNPEIVRFSNQTIRPLAERLRDLVIELEAIGPDVDRLLPGVPNDAEELVNDNRSAQGVASISGADVHALAAIREGVLATATPAARALVSKASVRPPRVVSS